MMLRFQRRLACVFVALLAPPYPAVLSQAEPLQQVSGEGNVAIQGVASGSQITVNQTVNKISQSLSETDADRLVERIAKKQHDLTAADQEKLATLSQELGVTKEAITGFFRILGQAQVKPEDLIKKLAEIASEHKDLLSQLYAVRGDTPEVIELRNGAKTAIERGDYEKAKGLLKQARQARIAAAEKLKEAMEAGFLDAAAISAEMGRVALTQLRYDEAAAYFSEAYATTPASHPDQQRSYLEAQANAYYNQGDEKGDNEALAQAIRLYRQLFSAASRNGAPLDWAKAQTNLGLALWRLGERESGTAKLEEAAAAFREALKEYTRERVPLDWAMTQNNLGTALSTLGERESGTARLEEAVAAYREALLVFEPAGAAYYIEKTKDNLGRAEEALTKR